MDFLSDSLDLPEPLRPAVDDWLQQHAGGEVLGPLLAQFPQVADELPRVLACSSYLSDVLARYPQGLADLLAAGRLYRSLQPGEIDEQFAAAVPGSLSENECEQQLRLLRHRELLRIAWRDLTGAADVEETLHDLSELADAAIKAALRWCLTAMQPIYGDARETRGDPAVFLVLGMGKLGGHELNFSSDVDLIFLYSDQGETTGRRSVSNEQYFRSLGQKLIALLSKQTADGFVYRVDVRLRPFGDSGPLAVSVPALETYLLRHGRDWERYAYVKARVINDWTGAAGFFDEVLTPFVYRRYLDYGVFASLREMKAMIEAEVKRREFAANLKLGAGGIREIEFIVQSLQLIKGGTLRELRQRRLLPALRELVRHGLLPAPVGDELAAAYHVLRRTENRLQAIADKQTHDLPENALDRARLALACNHRDWEALSREIERHRQVVARHFRQIVFRGGEDEAGDDRPDVLTLAWSTAGSSDTLRTELESLGYGDPAKGAERLAALRASGSYRRMDEIGRQRLDELIPALIRVAAAQDSPDQALQGGLTVIEAIGRRSAYFCLLNENPTALNRLLQICGLSDFLVRQLAAHPVLLDELLDPRVFSDPPGEPELAEELAQRLAGIAEDDVEAAQLALSHFQQAAVFRVAVADLSDALPLMKVSDRLTWIAEHVIEAALNIAWNELTARYGRPRCIDEGQPRDARFAVIAYGKLGGLELGYGSDLDLVFVHDSRGERQETDGERVLDNTRFFARLTQRVIHMLTLATPVGSLYEVDTRLRPSGRSGALVSSLDAFDRYQREDAWTWEHQALLRSRAVAGDAGVREKFEDLRKRALTDYVRRDQLRSDVEQMRERMREELSKGDAERFDIKQDAGGVADIEFLVQYLVLRDAPAHPALIVWSDNIRQLDALASCELLPAETAERLADCYRDYRARLHLASLAGQPGLAPRAELAEPAAAVQAAWHAVFD
jgi:glutamate-ammonia-ligase adenylyltransferase